MADLHLATVIADADLADTVELPVRLAGTTGLLKGTFLKLYTYLLTKLYAYAAPVNVAYAATVTLDFSTGINFKIGALTGNITIANPTHTTPGQSGLIFIEQDATGGRAVTWGNNFRFPGGGTLSGLLSTAASAKDMLAYFVRADGTLACSLAKDLKA